VGIAVAVIPVGLLNDRLWLAPAEAVDYGALRVVPDARIQTTTRCATTEENELVLTIDGADVVRGAVDVDVALCIGDEILRHLRNASGVAPLSAGIPISADKRLARATFTVGFQGSFPPFEWAQPVSIRQILARRAPTSTDRVPVHLGKLALPMSGNPRDYPLDTYSVAGVWTVKVPDDMEVVFGGEHQFYLRTSNHVVSSPSNADLVWHSGDVRSVGLAFQAERSRSSQAFIAVLLLLPILLFVGVLLTLAPRSKVTHDPDARLPAELLVGVGAFLIAVLPIRSVLVPADLARLTVVDYALGAEMAVMVAVAGVLAFEVRMAASKA
jgi:hypothetical protein